MDIKKKKIKTFDVILILFLIFLTWQMISIANHYDREGVACLASPLQYGYAKLEERNNASLVCQCSMSKPQGTANLYWDKESIKLDVKEYEKANRNFNFSELLNITNQKQNPSP